jgi:hypothetical protein
MVINLHLPGGHVMRDVGRYEMGHKIVLLYYYITKVMRDVGGYEIGHGPCCVSY